jgi:uncharacterized protein (DUF362 family)
MGMTEKVSRQTVILERCPPAGKAGALQDPRDSGLETKISRLIEELRPEGVAGLKVLIKPNLVKPGDLLAITSPEVIVAAARAAKALGAHVTVADSPAFGSAERVLKRAGIYGTLRRNGIGVATLCRPKKFLLPSGIALGISRMALEADLIVNLPRLKAHCQMGITCGVKNLFGTVVGFRKALCHTRFGGDRAAFSDMILDIGRLLPERITIADCLTAMHVTGPTGGRPLEMNILAGSGSEVALDTALYLAIGAQPDKVPLWKAAMKRGLPGSRPAEITYPASRSAVRPEDARPKEPFMPPSELSPLVFSPTRFIKGRIKSLLKRLPL